MIHSSYPTNNCGPSKANCTSGLFKSAQPEIPRCTVKKQMECSDCTMFYPIDHPYYGIHKGFTTGVEYNQEAGRNLDYSIPWDMLDVRDLGRSGECSDDCQTRGRIRYEDEGNVQIESKGWTRYIRVRNPDHGTTNCVYDLICKQDRRLPVEALSPFDLCDHNTYNCVGPNCPDTSPTLTCSLENPCPFQTVSLVCDGGVCKTGWLKDPIAVVDTNSVDMTLEPKQGGGIQIKSDVRICGSSDTVLQIKDCGLDVILCPDGALQKRTCGLSVKICAASQGTLLLKECGLDLQVEDTQTINLTLGGNGLKGDLKYRNTNTVAHSQDDGGFFSNVRYRDSPTINFFDDVNGLTGEVKICQNGAIGVTDCGLSVNISSCINNLTSITANGLCTRLYADPNFFTGSGQESDRLSFIPPAIPVGGTISNVVVQSEANPNIASALVTITTVSPPFPAPTGTKWVVDLHSTTVMRTLAGDPLQIDQETAAGHLIIVNGNASPIFGGVHAASQLVASPGYPKRVTSSSGGVYNVNQSGPSTIQLSLDVTNSGPGSNGNALFNPLVEYVNPTVSGILKLVRA